MKNSNKIIAIITARASSKGLPGKNFKKINGYPLFWWSVLAALRSTKIDLVALSTNCLEVKSSWIDMLDNPDSGLSPLDAERLCLINRPDSLSHPTSMNEEALIHTMDTIDGWGEFKWIMNLQPTSPIRPHGLIDNFLYGLIQSNKSSGMTVSSHTPFFISQSESDRVWHYKPSERPMRQSLSKNDLYMHDDGNIYAIRSNVFKETKCRINSDAYLHENSKFSSFQIDDIHDFKIVEKIMQVIPSANMS